MLQIRITYSKCGPIRAKSYYSGPGIVGMLREYGRTINNKLLAKIVILLYRAAHTLSTRKKYALGQRHWIRFQQANPLVDFFPFSATSLNATTLSIYFFLRGTWLTGRQSRGIPPFAAISVMLKHCGAKRGALRINYTPRSFAESCAASVATFQRRLTHEKHSSLHRSTCRDTASIHHPTVCCYLKRQWYLDSMRCCVTEHFVNSQRPNLL